MRLARLFLGLTIISSFFVLTTPQAHACSCMLADEESAFAQGNMVFRGTVIGIADDSETGQKSVAFTVEAVWHGPAVNGMIIYTAQDSAMCGVEYVIGQEYTVVANRSEGQLWSYLCGQAYEDSETGEAISPEEMVADREELTINNNLACVPYVCKDGSVHASCTQDGSQINYFVDPCMSHGGPAEEEEEENTGEGFSDVAESHSSFQAIMWAQANGVVEGYSDGTFRPSSYVNRAEFTKILIEAYGVNTEALCKIATFTDTSMAEWYGKYVQAARCNGVISGYPDGTFRPSANINFAEAAKIIANLNAGENLEVPGASVWYQVYLDYLVEHGATVSSLKSPGQLVTRAEMVELMFKLRAEVQ